MENRKLNFSPSDFNFDSGNKQTLEMEFPAFSPHYLHKQLHYKPIFTSRKKTTSIHHFCIAYDNMISIQHIINLKASRMKCFYISFLYNMNI